MIALARSNPAFKKAVVLSSVAHVAFFLFVLLSPHLQRTSRGEMIHYVELMSFPGGGGGGGGSSGEGGGGEEKIAETTLPERDTLRDLTTPQKFQQEKAPALRHPVEKPEKETRAKKEKKAVIQKQSAGTREAEAGSGKGKGSGSGVRLSGGLGGGPDTGSAYSSQIGLSNFPFTYYLQIIIDRVSSNWFTSLVDPGVTGSFQSTVHFRIYKNGQISEPKIEESSGIRSLDLSALRAIQTSAPFPPLPRAYEDEYLGIYLIFEHSK